MHGRAGWTTRVLLAAPGNLVCSMQHKSLVQGGQRSGYTATVNFAVKDIHLMAGYRRPRESTLTDEMWRARWIRYLGGPAARSGHGARQL